MLIAKRVRKEALFLTYFFNITEFIFIHTGRVGSSFVSYSSNVGEGMVEIAEK